MKHYGLGKKSDHKKAGFCNYADHNKLFLQGVPFATEPGISLIILTPMKILQRNLNRSMFFSYTFITQ